MLKTEKTPGFQRKPGVGWWRWGESNPRPAAGPEFFSERSLRFYFSAPSIA